MGTSKGYIAPSTPHWVRAKRGITSYLNDSSDSKKTAAAVGYARAINGDGFSNSRVVQAFSGVASFAAASRVKGVDAALKEIGLEDILALPPEDALNELISDFANDGATIDDALALDCIADALTVLEIDSFEDLSRIDTNRLIKEFVCQFSKHKFAQLFDKQIRNKFPNVEEATAKISELQEFIYYTIEQELTSEILSAINPQNLASQPIIQDTLEKGFKLLEEFYGE